MSPIEPLHALLLSQSRLLCVVIVVLTSTLLNIFLRNLFPEIDLFIISLFSANLAFQS